MADKKRGPKKGSKSNNPVGRPVLLPEMKIIRTFNKLDVERAFSETLTKTLSELEDVLMDPNAKALDVALARCLLEACEKGDQHRIEALLARVVGPVPKKVEVEGSLHSSLVDYIEQSENAHSRTTKENIQ